jgi:hypothetical protein
MPLFHRTPPNAALRAGLLAALVACCLPIAVSRGTRFWAAPWPGRGADPAAQDTDAPEDLGQHLRDVTRRVLEKERLAADLFEGRLSLTAAAARYRDLEEQPPAFNWEAFRRLYPGASDDERHCREVIGYVRADLPYRPGADPALADRLEAVLEDLLGRGDLRLPRSDKPPPGNP